MKRSRIFESRQEAGKKLGSALTRYKKNEPLILALPRGGVPVGFEIAKVLHAPLNVIIARKIGSPRNPEFGIGAIAEDNSIILDEESIRYLGISDSDLNKIIKNEKRELHRRVKLYRNNKPLPNLKGKTIILVDDGLATGVTAHAAILSLKKLNPKKIIFAAPVCAYDSIQELKNVVDEIICLSTPDDLIAIGSWYKDFNQTTDAEVIELLS